MTLSPHKRTTASGIVLGSKLLSFARSRLPVANKPKPHTRRAFLSVAPVPFAPLVDTHAFQPPPPYSAHDTMHLRVPHNTPEGTPRRGLVAPVGLGLAGVERGDGRRFDGLGRLSGGFRGGDGLREEVRRMLSEQRRRRAGMCELPTKRHDVFYASVEVQTHTERVPAVEIRIRRESVGSPTPLPKGWARGTISSELKRAASLARRASMSEGRIVWR